MVEQNNINSLGKDLMSMINDIVDYKLSHQTCILSARVVQVNDDQTVDIQIPPDSIVYHNIQNLSKYRLNPGDAVKIIKEGNSLTNAWIIGGFGLKDYTHEEIDLLKQLIEVLKKSIEVLEIKLKDKG